MNIVRRLAEAQGHDTNCDVNDHWTDKPCNCGHAELLEALDERAGRLRDDGWWIIQFDDPDHDLEVYSDEKAARRVFAERLMSWSCNLFTQVAGEFPDGTRIQGTPADAIQPKDWS